MLVAVSCLAGTAFSQNNPPAGAASATAPATDPAKLALAHDVIKAMQADRSIDAMTGQIKQMVAQQTASYLPADATPEQKAKIAKLQNEALDLAMTAAKGLIGKMDAVYAEVYSAEELAAIKAFFTSPEGQSMLAKQPQLMQRMMPLAQQMQGELMPQLSALMQKGRQEIAPVPAPGAPPSLETPAPAK
ncbi:MAG: DUF2059 domain-containing protein [Opitutaceae bacterium]